MTIKALSNCAMVVAICAAIAAPLAVWRNVQAETGARDEALRKQKDLIEELSAANANRKKNIASQNAEELTDKQMSELLRLRAEAGALRRQTNALARLQTQDGSTQTAGDPAAERAQELSGELLDAAKQIVAALPEAERRFHEKNPGVPEVNLETLRDYFPKVNGRHMPGVYSFTFVRRGGPRPGDNLLLIESNQHETPDGKVARTAAFADGHAEEVVSPDRIDADNYFRVWVKANWGTAGDSPDL